MAAGIKQVKDTMYEVIPGFLRKECIYDAVVEVDEDVSRVTVYNKYEKIKESIPAEWRGKIEKEILTARVETLPKLQVETSDGVCEGADWTVRRVYGWMIKDVVREPTAKRMWAREFPDLEVGKIWESMNVRYNSIECENNDCMIRHNVLYTNLMWSRIDRNVSDCVCLGEFFTYLRALIQRHWRMRIEDGVQWRTLLLFGAPCKRKGGSLDLLNWMLSHARYAIVLRRNYAHFEQKSVGLRTLFEGVDGQTVNETGKKTTAAKNTEQADGHTANGSGADTTTEKNADKRKEKYGKELTVEVEVEEKGNVSMMDVLKEVKKECGEVVGCRVRGETKI
ncbi:hypothetical protein N1851_028935 [Merluccius polli]|uniref:Uncharacterized protein n=1 Tax=Merluccius polli TaxID=89951 RepID=A0AA47M863_MERPO|nr:hypothetical protein N1851_028935 [Merluccius polli]